MIIVEGTDGSGKSTLCERLRADNVVDTVLLSPRLSVKEEGLFKGSFNYLAECGGNNRVVVDRLFLSELVYGPLLRKKICFTGKQLLELLDLILYFNYNPIIFCLPNTLNLKKGEDPIIVEKAYELHKRYVFLYDIFSSLTNPKPFAFKYDWEDPKSYPDLLEFLKP